MVLNVSWNKHVTIVDSMAIKSNKEIDSIRPLHQTSRGDSIQLDFVALITR